MANFAFKQVDVFTEKPFYGNPVAVVIGAERLDSEEMQRIARWTNLSETTFLLQAQAAGADYRLRIFAPRQELPFAGHPTIGSAHAAIESGFVGKKPALRQECAAGILDLTLEDERIFVRGPQPKIADVRRTLPFANKLLRIDVGPVWIVGEIADARALAALNTDMKALAAFTLDHEATGVTLFAPPGEKDSGNLTVAAYLRQTNAVKRFGERYVARQGMQMGRDGRVFVHIDEDGVRIGGHAVTCIEGSLKI